VRDNQGEEGRGEGLFAATDLSRPTVSISVSTSSFSEADSSLSVAMDMRTTCEKRGRSRSMGQIKSNTGRQGTRKEMKRENELHRSSE
jgi:hypothetical protein